MSLPNNLPTFRSGDRSMHSPEEFLRRFKRVLNAQGFDIEQHWHRLLPLCLSESNVRWIESHLPQTLDWRSAARAFVDQFGDPDRLTNARVELFKIQMRHGEPITDYTRRFEDQMCLANLADTEQSVAAYFRSSLPSSLRHLVESALAQMETTEPTVKQLIRVALSFAWKPAEARAPVRSAGSKSHADTGRSQHCQLHGWCGHITE